MITKDQAKNALQYLEAAAQHMQFEDEDHKTYNDGMRKGAVAVLKQFISENTASDDVKIVYTYKLRNGAGLYRDRSNWSKKGKTYQKRNNMMIGITYAIEGKIGAAFDKLSPDYRSFESYDAYLTERARLRKETIDNKAWCSQFIPDDWVVVAIPINVKADPIEINAREFYKGANS